MINRKLNVAVVGMGGIGNLHASIYKEDPLANLIAVCDIVKERQTRLLKNTAFVLSTTKRKCLRLCLNWI